MTKAQFSTEFDRLIHAFPGKLALFGLLKNGRTQKTEVYFGLLCNFPPEILHKAVDTLIAAGLREDRFPDPRDLRSACTQWIEWERQQGEKKIHRKLGVGLAPHECRRVEEPPSTALSELRLYAPYEAEHVRCKGLATCPLCGKHGRVNHPLIMFLKQKYPVPTANWHPAACGWMVCSECDK